MGTPIKYVTGFLPFHHHPTSRHKTSDLADIPSVTSRGGKVVSYAAHEDGINAGEKIVSYAAHEDGINAGRKVVSYAVNKDEINAGRKVVSYAAPRMGKS